MLPYCTVGVRIPIEKELADRRAAYMRANQVYLSYMYVCVCVCVCVCVHVYIRVCIYIYVYIYMYIGVGQGGPKRHISNTLATHYQHISNTLATHTCT